MSSRNVRGLFSGQVKWYSSCTVCVPRRVSQLVKWNLLLITHQEGSSKICRWKYSPCIKLIYLVLLCFVCVLRSRAACRSLHVFCCFSRLCIESSALTDWRFIRLCQYDMAKMCANFLKITSAELVSSNCLLFDYTPPTPLSLFT